MTEAELMLRKREIIATQATRGWLFTVERADAVIKQMTDAALDEPDKDKREQLFTEARAARAFWRQFLGSLESFKNVDAPDDSNGDSNGDFYEVATN
jgi:hypothetical protein